MECVMGNSGSPLGRANYAAGKPRIVHSRPQYGVGLDAIDIAAMNEGRAIHRRSRTNSSDVPVNALARRRRH